MAGRKRIAPLNLDEERIVRIALSVPENLFLSLHHYCLWRNADAAKIQVAARKALQAFLAKDKAFARWRATQPNLPPRAPVNAARKNEPEAPVTTAKPAPEARS